MMGKLLLLFVLATTSLGVVALQSPDTPEQSPTTTKKLTAKDWLSRLKTVVSESNYEVSFVLSRVGHEAVPYLWRHSVLPDGTDMEQLNLQNGPGREFIRVNQQISVFEPDQPPYSVYGNNINGPIPTALLNAPESLYGAYEFVLVGRSRVSGRPAQQIRVVSQDNTRYAYQVWLDEETAMLLKMNMLDKQGNVLEQIQVSSFSFSEQPHPYFQRVNQSALPKVMALPPTQLGEHKWAVSYVPVGMKEVKQDTRRLAISGQLVDYRLFSDGLVDVSVYVEPANQSLNQDVLLRHKLNTFLSLTNGNVQVTVIGEIPPETANNIARSLVVSR
ncbi:sigma-E factor regulatory protein RseB [Alteromonas sediminis]|uniref:Sigma-E factor regulatory protein RseB n=1 Tax=Alteromonas sediminis TaxID=2259342 RepID=A0A3N5Z5L2_9ALTE|nr:MucB/RseB C-terminal domain-containing protein [Alteromonas sediminis]RPJ65604.1 sigma-E factor regulatory protein RseB [Alteromonas sediminis]